MLLLTIRCAKKKEEEATRLAGYANFVANHPVSGDKPLQAAVQQPLRNRRESPSSSFIEVERERSQIHHRFVDSVDKAMIARAKEVELRAKEVDFRIQNAAATEAEFKQRLEEAAAQRAHEQAMAKQKFEEAEAQRKYDIRMKELELEALRMQHGGAAPKDK